jgi:thioredoxin 1
MIQGIPDTPPNAYVLDFYSPTCQPCKQIAKLLPKWSEETGMPVFGANIEEMVELAEIFGIRTVPTFVFIQDGEEWARHVGVPRLSQLTALIAED